MVRCLVTVALTTVIFLPAVAAAQEFPVYAGAAFAPALQTRSGEPLGGTTWGGSILIGSRLSPRLAVESETSFGGRYSWDYTYRPFSDARAHVVASRRDTYFSVQIRTQVGAIEPVVGLAYARARIGRHATIGTMTYFEDGRMNHGVAAVGGLDAAIAVTPNFYVVPTFRALVVARGSEKGFDPLGEQTRTGSFVFRYGAGARVTF